MCENKKKISKKISLHPNVCLIYNNLFDPKVCAIFSKFIQKFHLSSINFGCHPRKTIKIVDISPIVPVVVLYEMVHPVLLLAHSFIQLSVAAIQLLFIFLDMRCSYSIAIHFVF